MKIILREHVEHLGDRGDEVRVAAGYARNYLLPKGLAYPAGAGSAKQINDQQRTWAKNEQRDESAAQQLAARVGALELTVRRRAGDGGTLYGSVTNADVAQMLADAGIEIDRRKIQLKDPIKLLGDYELSVKLHRSVTPSFKLTVLSQAGQSMAEIQARRAELEPVAPRRAEAAPPEEAAAEERSGESVDPNEGQED